MIGRFAGDAPFAVSQRQGAFPVNEIVIAGDCRSMQLRSERAGPLNGRVYIVTLRLTDASGNSTSRAVKVTVPRDDSSGPAVDDGPSLTVASACP